MSGGEPREMRKQTAMLSGTRDKEMAEVACKG